MHQLRPLLLSPQVFLGKTAKLRELSRHFPATGFSFIVHAISRHIELPFLSSHFLFRNSLGFTFYSLVTEILLPSILQSLVPHLVHSFIRNISQVTHLSALFHSIYQKKLQSIPALPFWPFPHQFSPPMFWIVKCETPKLL